MNEVQVKAINDIRSEGAKLLFAKKGDIGTVDCSLVPRRECHYGKLPVRWGSSNRAFWVDPIFVRLVKTGTKKLLNKGVIEKYVPSPPESGASALSVPEGMCDFHFGSNLKLIRKARGLSQEGLASAMRERGASRISQTTVSNWENRADSPPGRFLRTAADALSVPAYALFVDLTCCNVELSVDFVSKLKEVVCQ